MMGKKYPDDCPSCDNDSSGSAPPSCAAITLATSFCYGDCEGCEVDCIANEGFSECKEWIPKRRSE
jgi:hypothetical protein